MTLRWEISSVKPYLMRHSYLTATVEEIMELDTNTSDLDVTFIHTIMWLKIATSKYHLGLIPFIRAFQWGYFPKGTRSFSLAAHATIMQVIGTLTVGARASND